MADFPAPNAGAAAGDPPVSAALLAYALFGVAAVVALVSSGFPVAVRSGVGWRAELSGSAVGESAVGPPLPGPVAVAPPPLPPTGA